MSLAEYDYHLECSGTCSLRAGTSFSDAATEMLLSGKSIRQIVAAAAMAGYKTNVATISRHKQHVVLHTAEQPEVLTPKASNIEILESIIAKGFENRKNWKPTISDTMKAMDMWFRLTQGNPFDELLDTLAAAGMGDEDPATEGGPRGVEVSIPDEDDA